MSNDFNVKDQQVSGATHNSEVKNEGTSWLDNYPTLKRAFEKIAEVFNSLATAVSEFKWSAKPIKIDRTLHAESELSSQTPTTPELKNSEIIGQSKSESQSRPTSESSSNTQEIIRQMSTTTPAPRNEPPTSSKTIDFVNEWKKCGDRIEAMAKQLENVTIAESNTYLGNKLTKLKLDIEDQTKTHQWRTEGEGHIPEYHDDEERLQNTLHCLGELETKVRNFLEEVRQGLTERPLTIEERYNREKQVWIDGYDRLIKRLETMGLKEERLDPPLKGERDQIIAECQNMKYHVNNLSTRIYPLKESDFSDNDTDLGNYQARLDTLNEVWKLHEQFMDGEINIPEWGKLTYAERVEKLKKLKALAASRQPNQSSRTKVKLEQPSDQASQSVKPESEVKPEQPLVEQPSPFSEEETFGIKEMFELNENSPTSQPEVSNNSDEGVPKE